MNFEEIKKEDKFNDYQKLLQIEIDNGKAPDQETATKIVELALFNEKIEQFEKSDLTPDADGSYATFEQKVKDIFPEMPEDRFRSMKTAITMHLHGL